MKLIKILKWEASKVAVAQVFAQDASDLATVINDLQLTSGSVAYLANGDVYILGNEWTKKPVATGSTSQPTTPIEELPSAEEGVF